MVIIFQDKKLLYLIDQYIISQFLLVFIIIFIKFILSQIHIYLFINFLILVGS